MIYRTNDAILELPDAWHDQTVYVFSSENTDKQGISFVITKENLNKDDTLETYKKDVILVLEEQFPEFKVLREMVLRSNKNTEFVILEYIWKSNYGIMHHLQAFTLVKSEKIFSKAEKKAICFTMTSSEELFKEDFLEEFKQILISYKRDK